MHLRESRRSRTPSREEKKKSSLRGRKRSDGRSEKKPKRHHRFGGGGCSARKINVNQRGKRKKGSRKVETERKKYLPEGGFGDIYGEGKGWSRKDLKREKGRRPPKRRKLGQESDRPSFRVHGNRGGISAQN